MMGLASLKISGRVGGGGVKVVGHMGASFKASLVLWHSRYNDNKKVKIKKYPKPFRTICSMHFYHFPSSNKIAV